MKLFCKRCGYDWEYKGKSQFFTSCPKCRWGNVKIGGDKKNVGK